MKTRGKLISKEELRSNFKLTFKKWSRKYFLILHDRNKKIFNWLKIGNNYSFLYKKGEKNIFINENTIKLIAKPPKAKKLFIKNLAQKLKMPKTSLKNLIRELEKTRQEARNKADFLKQAKQLIQLLFLKHQELNKTSQYFWSTNEQKENQLLEELKTMFLIDYIYPHSNQE